MRAICIAAALALAPAQAQIYKWVDEKGRTHYEERPPEGKDPKDAKKMEEFIHYGVAASMMAMQDAGLDFSAFVWGIAGGTPIQNRGPIPTMSPLSEQLSKALKSHGFKFVGPVIVYAWMQAVGIVNDHAPACFRRKAVGRAR